MHDRTQSHRQALLMNAVATLLGATGAAANAQGIAQPETFNTRDPNPYYIGIRQALTHDSNVYRVPFGPSDSYSTTSLFGGFEQPISRQRVFGNARVGVNRYQSESQLNNVSYGLAAGLDWETINNLSGDLDVGMNRNLVPPPPGAAALAARRNMAQTENIDLRARWGGRALLTLEGTLGYSRLRYSAPEYFASESNQTTASIGLRYHPGGPLRLGVAARTHRTKTPKAFLDPASGNFQSSTLTANTLEGSADYEVSGQLSAGGRLGYTRQTTAGAGDADFSGLTGGLNLSWQPTAKISVRLEAARDAGFDNARYNVAPVTLPDGSISAPNVALLQNSRVTDSVGLSATYAATAKISANAGLRYVRAKLNTTNASGTSADSTDVVQSGSLGANYAISRAWGAACNLSRETRKVSGAFSYGYSANTISCSTQFIWR